MVLSGKSTEELVRLREQICAVPENKSSGGLFLFTTKTRKKLDEIDRAITQNIRERKIANGIYIDDSGYSGRVTKRGRG